MTAAIKVIDLGLMSSPNRSEIYPNTCAHNVPCTLPIFLLYPINFYRSSLHWSLEAQGMFRWDLTCEMLCRLSSGLFRALAHSGRTDYMPAGWLFPRA